MGVGGAVWACPAGQLQVNPPLLSWELELILLRVSDLMGNLLLSLCVLTCHTN